jgi:hypothetical protein
MLHSPDEETCLACGGYNDKCGDSYCNECCDCKEEK